MYTLDGISVVIGYANCNHPPERPPHTYERWGPNGVCLNEHKIYNSEMIPLDVWHSDKF